MNENLWAPWRIKYIERASGGSGNIFIDLPTANDDRKNLILYRGTHAFVMMNAFPYTSGHLMVATFRQTNDLPTMTDAELLEINQLVAKSIKWLTAAFNPQGFNVGVNIGSAGGAGIPIHLHWHIVPRWTGDTNFMTTIGEVRVMPHTLEESYDKIMEAIRNDA
jgi:ATP adenylyltransferase